MDASHRNKYGAQALSMCAASGHLSTVRLLLEAGAKVGDSAALGGRSQGRRFFTVMLLLEAGAKVGDSSQ
jgi:ankyrin repeat protein